MSYTIQGIVGDHTTLAAASVDGGSVIPLSHGRALLPFTVRLRAIHDLPFLPLTGGGEEVPAKIGELCSSLSETGKVAYIEAEFFGGDGTQACAVWENGRMLSAAVVDSYAINAALTSLAVVAEGNLDPFDTLGLGRHRDTEEWIK